MVAPVTNAVGKNEYTYTENQKWIPSLCFLIQLQMDERCKDWNFETVLGEKRGHIGSIPLRASQQ